MVRKKSKILTDTEAKIMDILWQKGEASVREVCDEIESQPAYTSVATIMRILEKKGYIAHKVCGRTYIYYPVCDKTEERGNVLTYITQRFFEGSVKSLLVHLIQGSELSSDQLRELKEILEEETGEREES